MSTTTDNTLNAAEIWLARMGADPASTVVVTIRPTASVGWWPPGASNVIVHPDIDDAGAELAEAVAPFVKAAIERLDHDVIDEVMAATAEGTGGRLQALLVPAQGDGVLRLVRDGHAHLLAALVREDVPH